MNSMRVDKWLWAARFFKTRPLAAQSCEMGRIEVNGLRAKASREVHVGDKLQVKNEVGEFHIELLRLSESRGSAAVAQEMFSETEASKAARQKVVEERRQMLEMGGVTESKPSKRDRAQHARLRGRG